MRQCRTGLHKMALHYSGRHTIYNRSGLFTHFPFDMFRLWLITTGVPGLADAWREREWLSSKYLPLEHLLSKSCFQSSRNILWDRCTGHHHCIWFFSPEYRESHCKYNAFYNKSLSDSFPSTSLVFRIKSWASEGAQSIGLRSVPWALTHSHPKICCDMHVLSLTTHVYIPQYQIQFIY